MGTVTVNGVRLAYEESGTGPPVIWVHGGFTDRRGADFIATALAEHHRFITYDRRGHSQSERVPGHQGVMDQVADLAALIERLDAAPAHLLANSDGGEIAFRLAVHHPSGVASLAVNEPSLHWLLQGDPRFEQIRAAMQARLDQVVDELAQGNDEAAARLIVEIIGTGPDEWESLPEQTRRTLVRNANTWLDYGSDPTQGRIHPDRVRRISVPVLLTQGGRSAAADRAVVQRLAELLPHARRHTFADAGHTPHRTHPDQYAAVVNGFLGEVAAPLARR